MNNSLKTAALSLGVAVLFGSVVIASAQSDSMEKSSESHHSESVTAAPAPAVVMVRPAPVMVAPAPEVVAEPINREHSASHSVKTESSPNSNSVSEKSSSSNTAGY